MVKYYTVESLRDKLNELIEKGYKDFEVAVTYDGGVGMTSPVENVEPLIETREPRENYVLFAEDDVCVKGFDW